MILDTALGIILAVFLFYILILVGTGIGAVIAVAIQKIKGD